MKKPVRILVVEDEGITALDLEHTLQRLGYETAPGVASGEEAVRAAADPAVDLVLTDIVLRGNMDGIEAAAAIRRLRPVPVVFLSAYGDVRTLERARSAEPFGYLIKPFHDEELRSTIETALLRTDLERRLAEAGARCRELLHRVQEAREEERRRVAREIHDELGQVLTHVRLELAWLRDHPSMPGAETASRLGSLVTTVDGAIGSLRRIVTDLRPPVLDEAGLVAAVEWQCRSFTDRSRVPCVLRLELSDEEAAGIGPGPSAALFRILQESLTNVARHARAHEVEVTLGTTDGRALLRVRDDGTGLPAHASGGLGIAGMRERALVHGGSVQVHEGPEGRGTEVEAALPLLAPREGGPPEAAP